LAPEDHNTQDVFDAERVLYHGHGLLVIDKPAGVPVHRGTGHDLGIAELVEQWISLNPGVFDLGSGKSIHPVHRLDLEATGVLVLALKKSAARSAKEAFSDRSMDKRYLALVAGPVDEKGTLKGRVRTRIRGQYKTEKAEVSFRRLRSDERMSLVEVVPEGGKTHQIRSVFAENGRPLCGDLRYGRPKPAKQFLEKFGVEHLLLHAWKLGIPGDVVGHELTLEADLPESFARVCDQKGWSPLEQDEDGEWIAEAPAPRREEETPR